MSFSSLPTRAWRAASELQIGFQWNRSTSKVTLRDLVAPENVFATSRKGVARWITKILARRHSKQLTAMVYKGHSFNDLLDSKESNKLLGKPNTAFSDKIIAFLIRGRLNSLPTKEMLHKANEQIEKFCPLCPGNVETLNHRLNGCIRKRTL